MPATLIGGVVPFCNLDGSTPPQTQPWCNWPTTVSLAQGACVPTALTCNLTASPTSGAASLSTVFTATVSGGTPNYNWSIDYGDGTIPHGSGSGASVTFNHTYTAAGNFIAKATVTDNFGNQCEHTATVTVTGGGACSLTTTALGTASSITAQTFVSNVTLALGDFLVVVLAGASTANDQNHTVIWRGFNLNRAILGTQDNGSGVFLDLSVWYLSVTSNPGTSDINVNTFSGTPIGTIMAARKVAGSGLTNNFDNSAVAEFTTEATLDSGSAVTSFNCELWSAAEFQYRGGLDPASSVFGNGFTQGQGASVIGGGSLHLSLNEGFVLNNGPGPADAVCTSCLQDLAIISVQAFD